MGLYFSLVNLDWVVRWKRAFQEQALNHGPAPAIAVQNYFPSPLTPPALLPQECRYSSSVYCLPNRSRDMTSTSC